MRLAIPIGVIAVLGLGAFYLPASKHYAAIDRCLASGGAWGYQGRRCAAVPAGPVDRILVDKSDRRLLAYRGGILIREFRVALGRGGLGPKRRQGDGRVPEGEYLITFHNAASAFHRSLRIGYPTDEQLAAAQQAGINLGGDIMIHGLPNGMGKIGSRHVRRDWTEGCIAVTNKEMDWLFETVPDNTPVEIRA
ncbi:MAG TPA: L,D-transpeptidase family protein [Sphingomicrobium sp.]|nr:L,D-transpeptidase family protein [Sphingomicrobium sp.]